MPSSQIGEPVGKPELPIRTVEAEAPGTSHGAAGSNQIRPAAPEILFRSIPRGPVAQGSAPSQRRSSDPDTILMDFSPPGAFTALTACA